MNLKTGSYHLTGISKAFKTFLFCFFICSIGYTQNTVSGTVTNKNTGKPLNKVKLYDKKSGFLAKTNQDGNYKFTTNKEEFTLTTFALGYQVKEEDVTINSDKVINIKLENLSEELTEVEVIGRNERIFELSRLKDVEETAIYAGKKTEVIQVDQSMANLATNNARQIYSRVAGLNIYQNDDAGLQLNIGGRGLNPNRTSNFNVRQNGYDISADALGYPESYYTPPSEALEEIQIIRGAASLQYGTQFGGLVNFKIKKPEPNDELKMIARNTGGSNGLFTSFTSLSGTKGKFSYYSFVNYKRGDGFRPNSDYESINLFAHVGYEFSDRTKLTGEITYMNYLAHQAGGLTDQMFEEDPYQSNRKRNWFDIDWLLYNVKLAHEFSDKTNFTFSFFGLDATRKSLGFRTNRVNQIDQNGVRDLIKGDFNNYGFEARLLTRYKVLGKKSTFLIGNKFYNSDNRERQGPGSDGSDADFSFRFDEFPNYQNQINYELPNLNVAVFGENIFYLNDKLSITPGFRFEYIKTESDGFFRDINTDAAGNPIFNEIVEDQRSFERNFILIGLGTSYKPNDKLEIYGNISENYRSVTFADININNPAFSVDPDITDEKGFTADIGVRGNYDKLISYDASLFGLLYNRRIGFVEKKRDDNRLVSERSNVGDAFIYGVESLIDFNLKKVFSLPSQYRFSYFINTSFIQSEYTSSDQSGIEGNEVEFVPELNFKTGLTLSYKDFRANVQYSYLSEQFTDASNSTEASLSGVIGKLPQYDILDLSMSYTYKEWKLETGINNILDEAYFTRRATGYPGPGIIPSPPRNWYVTLQVKF